jgi:hypothetical protein
MKKTWKLLTYLLLLAILLVPTHPAQAQGPGPGGGGQVLFGRNYTVSSGETYQGDLVVFGGNVTIEEDATLQGDLVVIGGTIHSNGETEGDVVVVGGQIHLDESAVVTGDVVTVGGQLSQAEGARIAGDVVNNIAPTVMLPSARIPPSGSDVPIAPDIPSPEFDFSFNPFAEVFWIFFWAVIVGAFAMLISLFWQPQIERTAGVIVTQPLLTGAIGLAAVFTAAILFLTVIPPLLVAFAWLFGIVAMGAEVGQRFSKAINQSWTPVLTIGFGTFLLMLIGGAIGLIPCLGGMILFLLGMVGIGGSLVSWFGVRLPTTPVVTLATPPTDEVPPAS